MSKQKHTPEPWRVIDDRNFLFIAAEPYEGHPYHGVARSIEIMSDEAYPTKSADAHRIVACVNACKGISIENLEQSHIDNYVDKLIAERADALLQRDELLAALRVANDALSKYFEATRHMPELQHIDDTAAPVVRAAIVKAEKS